MERRSYPRKTVDADVVVYLQYQGRRIGDFKPVNLSSGGVLLETGATDLPRATPLDLLFALSSSSSNVVRLHRLSAVVAYAGEEGVGMTFCGNAKRLRRRRFSDQSSIHTEI